MEIATTARPFAPSHTGGVRGKKKAPKKKETGRDERKYARKTRRNNSYAYGTNAETSVLGGTAPSKGLMTRARLNRAEA